MRAEGQVHHPFRVVNAGRTGRGDESSMTASSKVIHAPRGVGILESDAVMEKPATRAGFELGSVGGDAIPRIGATARDAVS